MFKNRYSSTSSAEADMENISLKRKEIALGKRPLLMEPKKIPILEEKIPETVKLKRLHQVVGTIECLFERNVNESGTSVGQHRVVDGNEKYRLLDFAQQTISLHTAAPLLKCDEGDQSAVWKGSEEFTQLVHLLEALKTLNEMVCQEIESESKTGNFSARNSKPIIDSILSAIDKINASNHHNQGESLTTQQIEIPIERLCSIWHAIEHNAVALKALADYNLEEETTENSGQQKRVWWEMLESISNILQHELYATIVYLSRVEETISVHKQNELSSINNLLNENAQKINDLTNSTQILYGN